MILLFPRAKEMAVRGWSLICHDLSRTEIGIKLDILQRCIKQSVGLFTPKPDSSIPIKLPEWIEALKRLTWFQPETSTRHMFNFWINDAKPRRTCNAAVAMSFLKHRDNDRVADRLAILANLCDYSLRLNTVELEKSQGRLSVCVLALAIANGDFSLLSPESYHIFRGLDVTRNKGDKEFTWVPPNVTQLQYIRSRTADPGGATPGRVSPVSYRVTNEGLSLRGFMWKIDRFVELPSIKHKYKESWARLWRPSTRLEEQSLEVMEKPYIFQQVSRAHWLAVTHIFFEVIELLREKNQISVADAVWHSVTDADWRKGRFLESVAEFPEQLTVEKRKGMFCLEQSTDGSLEHKWLIGRIMLQGGLWIGRRVRLSTDHEFSDGTPSGYGESDAVSGEDQVGCATQDQRLEAKFRSPAREHTAPNIEAARAVSAFQADDVAREAGQPSPLASVDGSMVPATPHSGTKLSDSLRKPEKAPKTHSDYQSTLSMMMKMHDHGAITKDDSEGEVDDPTDPDKAFRFLPENSADFVALMNNMDGRNSQTSLRQQRAVFNIEGDTSGQVLVLTPFQKRLETLPRPETRSMSVSWVVQPVSNLVGAKDSRGSEFFGQVENLKTSGMVRGMWKCMVQPEDRYNLV